MRFVKPAWIVHTDSSNREQSKRHSIFSCHVHPDGSRIATGGLDAKVRIWSTKPILNHASEVSGRPPKLLCTLAMHTGPVLTVRWAHSGRWLASGSDDTIIMIWDLDPTARGKVWGSDEVNVEGWKPLKRLPGHESDVTDLAWSPGDRYLASVGLDSRVIIWCGFTLERLRRLDQHQGFVKGVCWDPVGEFLATQSDDRSVKVWRTTDWELEAEVRKPFEDSPGTFFRRLSWSPDGAHITASNATNNKGYVFTAAVIKRGTWTSEISLVGHENTVEVAAYNPHIFLRDHSLPVVASNICSVVALGADDRSVSVWQTKSARPLVVAKEVFERQIMDLSWSTDGLSLYAVSSDGTMAVFSFDPEELEGIVPHAAQDMYLQKFGFIPPPLPEGYSHQSQPQTDTRMTPPPSPGKPHPADGFEATGNGVEHVNKLVAKRKPQKKRIQPTLVGTTSAAQDSIPSAARTNGRSFAEITGILSSRPSQPPTISSSREPFDSVSAVGRSRGSSEDVNMELGFGVDDDMNIEVPISAFDNPGGNKRKSAGLDDERPGKPRTLGGDRVRESVQVREIVGPSTVVSVGAGGATSVDPLGGPSIANRLPPPAVLTYLKATIEGSEDIFEGRNSETEAPTEVVYVAGKQTQWLDFLPSPVLALVGTSFFCAAAMQDGSLNIYSPTGRRLFPTLTLGSPCFSLSASRGCLMAITSVGQLYVWNIKELKAAFPPVSITSIFGPTPDTTIVTSSIRPNGAPIIQLSTGVALSYDSALCVWVKLSECWWAEGSDVWQSRQRVNTLGSTRGIVSLLESTVSERAVTSDKDKVYPAWWNTAITLGHLETRLHAAKALDSPQEYKQQLILYAKRIADEGFRAKAEELVKELFGPMYWRPGKDSSWSPTVLGLSKRDLLRDVLLVFARSKTLTKMALDWQDTLKKVANED